jgi:hypothetical protein
LEWRSIQKIKTYIVVYQENIRVLECIYISVYKEEYKKLKGNKKDIISKLKKFYKELFNKNFPEKFDGLDIIKTLQLAASKYGIKFIIYNHDENERLQHLNTIGSGEIIHNLLMINGPEENSDSNIITHVMYIKDIQNILNYIFVQNVDIYLQLHLMALVITKIDLKTMSKIVMVE